ncbi:MAG: 50S ribosomal protein L21 [Candidatus Sulfobium sp.]|jgi:large subunit ribosomal protein L21
MYAVIESGGQQFRVSPGDTIKVQKVPASEKDVNIEKVLVVWKDDNLQIGKPYVENASVKAEIVGDVKSRKVLVYKKKPRKGYRKLNGHRQNFTLLKIKDIVFGG